MKIVYVSSTRLLKGHVEITPVLDGMTVPGINSYLFGSPSEGTPVPLRANNGKSFLGHKVLGMGFVFDDESPGSHASTLADMQELLERNPKNADRICPYIGGAEINSEPSQRHRRFAINFSDMSLAEAEEWPDLISIVREKVLPERAKLGGYSVAEKRSERWWQYGTYAAALQDALAPLSRFLARSRISATHAVAFLPSSVLVTDGVIAFPFSTYASFAVLQSRPHEVWARFFASSMKDDLRYTPSDCFDTFAFPEDFEANTTLEFVGKKYYEFRADLMIRKDEGLTKTYNRFHDPHEESSDIINLRELHAEMDRAVLDAYGWTDLKPTCEFLLDYEEEEDEDEPGRKPRKRKKPWRYRWPDDFRDEVLARLLDLNQKRAEEERLAGKATASAKKAKASKRGGTRRKKTTQGQERTLFEEDV